jgi:hypothetical protein
MAVTPLEYDADGTLQYKIFVYRIDPPSPVKGGSTIC